MDRSRSFSSIGAIVLFAWVGLNDRACAQNLLFDIPDPNPGSAAAAPASAGDWDGDGVLDFAIGAGLDDSAGIDAGVVRIYSGKNASLLATLLGATAGDLFGGLVVRFPDLNGDGRDDLGVLASEATYLGVGSIYLMAGGTGSQLLRIDCPAAENGFGEPFGPLDDVDGDGVGDLFASFAGWSEKVSIRSGADGHEIALFTGSNELFGYSVDALDDLDGDGVHELLVGAPYHLDPNGRTVGVAYVISTATGSVLRTHIGNFDGEQLGGAVAMVADLDGDGVHDYAIGAIQGPSSFSSKVIVRSGASGALLGTILPPAKGLLLAGQIADAGDVNGDGVGDVVTDGSWTDASGNLEGAVFLVSGRTLLHLDRIEFDDPFVVLTPRLGDLDGDGKGDLAVGTRGITPATTTHVRVYSGDDLWLNATPTQPTAGATLALSTREGNPGALELLVREAVDATPTFVIVGGPTTFDASGGVQLSGTTPAGLAGHDFTLRAYADDANGRVIRSAVQTVSCR